MKKRIVSIVAVVSMLLSMFPAIPAYAAGTASGYLIGGDYCVISPAEKWNSSGQRVAVATTEWELTAQASGTANGNDVQTWKYGVSDKFYVEDAGSGTFRLRCKNFRESGGGRYWDIEGRSKKPGANVHVWSYKDSDSQKFYLEEDNDNDPETFYIKNKNSGLYLVPENYFKDPKNNCSMKRNSWSEEGCNTILSNYAFRWRIQVLNRDAAEDAGSYDKYANWMSKLPDYRYLSEINIPGTHDSGTTNVEGSWNSSYNVVACQKYFIEQQLYAGIRSLDIRTAWNNDSKDMVLIHGNKSTVCHTPDHGNSENKRFSSVIDTMIKFLEKHPKETIVMTLKIDDGDSAENRQRLGNILLKYLNDDTKAKYFYKWSEKDGASDARKDMTSPTLGQVRGKIVILSRVNFDISDLGIDNAQKNLLCRYTGPDISNWDARYDDDDHYAQKITDSDSGVAVYIQDDYSSPDGNKKTQLMNTIDQLNGQLNISGAPTIDKKDFVFNYASKTTSDSLGASPLGGAKYMNNIIYNDSKFTPSTAKGASQSLRTGIVVMDYINKQLARRIIDLNNFPGTFSGSTTGTSGGLDPESSLMAMAQAEPEIVWPTGAEITYGYVLSEAALKFDESAGDGPEGRFVFNDPDEILTAAGSPHVRTITFVPADGSEPQEHDVTVTVNKRPLPIKVGNYDVEYGDTFKREDITVSAGGYLLTDDFEKLNEVIEQKGIHYLLKDSEGNEITYPEVPGTDVLASGTIDIRSDNPSDDPEAEFPNYAFTLENGTWTVTPRTVSVSWSHYSGSWHAELGNIINDDDVKPEVTDNGDNTATLSLAGEKASFYQIAEADEISPVYTKPSGGSGGSSSGSSNTPNTPETPEQPSPAVQFKDVSDVDWFFNDVVYVSEKGLMNGTGNGNFSPYDTSTRAMIVTVLYRMEGSPEVSAQIGFKDVKAGSYYENAVKWAATNNIVNGYSDEVFGCDDDITREQMAAILYRYAVYKGMSGVTLAENLGGFSDSADISAYAVPAMQWAVANGIITDKGDGTLDPRGNALRSQIAAILHRFCEITTE